MNAESFLGYQVTNTNLDICVQSIEKWIRDGQRCRRLSCINPHSYAIARSHAGFSAALKSADWLIPDGAGIVLGSRFLRGDIRTRICGPDVFSSLHQRLNSAGDFSVFLLGSTMDTLQRMCSRLETEWSQLKVVGVYSPPFAENFTEQESDAMVKAVNSASPDVLWVGMTSPKQDLWLAQVANRLEVPFAGGVGAAFDFYAGNVRRSSSLFRNLGLEWVSRLAREPSRMWRRTLISAPIFLADLINEKYRRLGR